MTEKTYRIEDLEDDNVRIRIDMIFEEGDCKTIKYYHNYNDIEDLLIKIGGLQSEIFNSETSFENRMGWLHLTSKVYNNILENEGNDYLYFILGDGGTKVKIGRANDVDVRYNQLKRNTPFDIQIHSYVANAGKYEGRLHNIFKESNIKFDKKFDGYTEWFKINKEISTFIKNTTMSKIQKLVYNI
jgi:hypothetical protein